MGIRPRRPGSLLGLLLVATVAHAHDSKPERHALLSVEATKVQLVVRFVMRPTAATERLFAALDADHDGRVSRPTEKLARAQLLVPRARQGLTLLADGRPLEPTTADVRFRDLSAGARRGVETLLLLEAPLDNARPHRLTLKVSHLPTLVEAQVTGRRRVDTSLPTRPDDPVVGPARVDDGTAWIEVAPR